MPAKSKEQQRLFGMVHAYQKGELKNPSKEVKDIAKTISKKDAKDFAETKHKGLPNKVKKSVKETVTLNEAQLRAVIAESIKKVLSENDMSQEESEFRKSLSPNYSKAELVYQGKLSNGNTLVTYNGILFEVTPKGKLIRVQNGG